MLAAAERARAMDGPAQEALLTTANRYESPFVGRWA
jgi:hypothetical protein